MSLNFYLFIFITSLYTNTLISRNQEVKPPATHTDNVGVGGVPTNITITPKNPPYTPGVIIFWLNIVSSSSPSKRCLTVSTKNTFTVTIMTAMKSAATRQ